LSVSRSAATAPELISGVIELAPFTRAQTFPIGGLITDSRYRKGTLRLARVMMMGSRSAWKSYLDLAYPTKPADWDAEIARIDAKLSEPGRMKALQAMTKTNPGDAGAQLANVRCPVLVIEGDKDPDWTDPREEGQKIINELPDGLGELVVLEGAGHYPHAQMPNEVLATTLPFLRKTLVDA
jgi:pimeloyl-ACP methyl ester carboxylesterase